MIGNGVRAGWSAHPEAIDDHTELEPVEPGRVIGLGAICDLRTQDPDARSRSFSVSEFVKLEDGRRVILHEARGFTIGWRSADESGSGPVQGEAMIDTITQNVLNVVRPDDEGEDDHPWPWLAELARARGLDVTPEDLRGLQYEVILTDNVAELRKGRPE